MAERMETGTAVVDGVATFFRRVPGEGPPVVFVHGVPTHSEDWLPFLERIRGPAIALDLPGFGRSDRPPLERFDYTMHGYARFFTRFLERMGIGEHSLVVHDWGSIALIAAQEQPERVRRLVVINAVPLLPGYHWHRTARIWRTPVLAELSMRIRSRALLDWGLRESRGDWSRHDPAFVDSIADRLDAGTFRAILSLYRSAPETELAAAGGALDSLEGPSLVVWGMRDRYLPPRFGRDWAERLPGASLLELDDAGHWPWRDDPATIDPVIEFLLESGSDPSAGELVTNP
jgi:pimeloyl-ACP methyl ester carboxylesterase